MKDLSGDIDELPPGAARQLAALAVQPRARNGEAAPLPGDGPQEPLNKHQEDTMEFDAWKGIPWPSDGDAPLRRAHPSPRDVPAHKDRAATGQGARANPFNGPPLRSLLPGDPPSFPVDALPPVLARWVREMARVNAVREDVPAGLALGVLSCATAWVPKGEPPIRIEAGAMSEPMNLYCVVVEESGSNKSAVLQPALAPLQEIGGELRLAAEPDRARCEAQRAVLQMDVDALKDALRQGARKSKGKSGTGALDRSRDDMVRELEDAQIALEAAPQPPEPCIIEADTTPEALAVAVAENPAFCLASAEGHEVFAGITGRYGNGANMDLMLKAWSCDHTSVRRKGAPRLEIPDPVISWAVAVQPVTLRKLGRFDGDLSERGLTGRILFLWPVTVLGTRKPPSDERLAGATADAYRQMIRRAFDHRAAIDAEGSPSPMRMDGAAKRLFDEFYIATERRMADGADLAWCRSMVSKMRSQVLRLAGLFHLASGGAPGGAVTEETTRSALALGEYFLTMGIRSWRAIIDGDEPSVVKVWATLKSRAEDTGVEYTNPQNPDEHGHFEDLSTFRGVSERDLWQYVRRSFAKKEDMMAVVDELVEAGYVARIAPRVEGPGRPQSAWIVLNPEA
jgi:replicative DNA helicase